MKAKAKRDQIEILKNSLVWWTDKRAEAIKNGDSEALAEAEAGRENTIKAIEEINGRRQKK